jgi:predicted lipid-binding transport protein (Tim44 family)
MPLDRHSLVPTLSYRNAADARRQDKRPARMASVQDVFDIYTIIFLALAVFIFLRLRSVLGQRTGRERPPFNPFAARETRPEPRPVGADKVVALPPRPAETPAAKPANSDGEPPAERWKDIAAAGSDVAKGLDAIAAEDKTFDAKHFIAGARGAYEMIVTA